MKLRYYLRGLGIGMIVTAFILSVVIDKDTKTMSDDEVMARARELGMVESTVLSQIAENKQNKTDTKETVTDDSKEQENSENMETAESEASETETSETDSLETETTESGQTESEPVESENTEPETGGQDDEPSSETQDVTVTIVITPGESSESVSLSLEEAGLVESAKTFDRYLCDSGYDNIIAVGAYEITVGTTEEEIAKIITKRK